MTRSCGKIPPVDCSIEGCDKPAKARGWCSKHWERWRRVGATDLPPVRIACVDCGVQVTAGGNCQRYCKECKARRNRERAADYRRKNPDKAKARGPQRRAYAARRRLEAPEKVKQAGKTWRLKNRERRRVYAVAWREANRERLNAHRRAYYRRNRERLAAQQADYQRRRYAVVRGSGEAKLLRLGLIAERDHWECHLCGGRVAQENWSLDHLIPVSMGGPHTEANVALAHLLCNMRRGVRDVSEYRAEVAALRQPPSCGGC